MPPKKKQGRVSNKKNKGQRANAGSATNRSSSGRTTNHSQHQDLLRSITNVPVFHSTGQESAKPSRSNNYYGIYKQATTRFWNWMKQALPENKMTAINDLWKGADQLLEHNIALLQMPPPPPPIVVPPGIMADLSRSIRYRTFVAETKFGTSAEGEDEGHRYIIEVLRYCRKKLRYGRGVAKLVLADAMEEAVGADEDEVAANHIGGRFNALLMEDNDEDEDEVMEQIEKDIRERNFPEMEAPKAAKKEDEEMDIQKALINGDDRFQAMALLHTMDDWMGVVDGHYGLLKNAMRDQDSRDGSVLQLLMECAEVVNLATQSVHEAEQALALAHPRLSSFYRVLALVFLPHFVAEVEAMLNKTPKEKQEHDLALEFVAEVIECAFHNMGDDKVPGKVKRFAQRTGIKFKEQLNQTAQEINMLASLEVQLHQEEALNTSRNALILAQAGLRPHQWLQQSIHIGGDRCLLNTQCLVQKLMGIVREKTKLVGKRGFWGPEFNEMRPARRIRGDLDEVFAANIMPELMEICFRAPFSCLPDRPQLITVLELMQQYINKDRTSPVPVALTFGLHAVLTSIFVLQGDGDLARIATYTKQSYNTLFSQLDKISEPSRPPENAPNFYKNVAIFKNLVNFAKPVPCHYDPNLLSVDPETSEKMAFWNPVIGGEYMLYSTYVCSINLGSATVDSLGQLRFTLHLYNALLNCEGDEGRSLQSISFLRTVDKAFTRTKAVWPAGKPQKGSYSKNFWIAWGVEATEAARMASRPSSDDDSQVIQNVKQRSSANTVR